MFLTVPLSGKAGKMSHSETWRARDKEASQQKYSGAWRIGGKLDFLYNCYPHPHFLPVHLCCKWWLFLCDFCGVDHCTWRTGYYCTGDWRRTTVMRITHSNLLGIISKKYLKVRQKLGTRKIHISNLKI